MSSLLAWTSGSITFDRLLVGTYGSLYVRSASGQYRFEPNNAAINALSAGTSESFPVTVADNLGATGTGSFTASITAVNDRPVVTVTAANLADVTDGLATSAYSLYHATAGTGSTPGGEEVYRAFDNSSSTKYLNFSGAGSGVTIDLGASAAYAVSGLGLTTANDSSDRDPTSYEVYGSNNGTSFNLVASGSMTAPTARLTNYTDITFSNSALYRWYRVVFPTVRGSSMMQISEIRLPAQSGNLLRYTEGAPAGVVLTGIDVTDADTARLTGATVSITSGLTTGDVLAFTNDGSTMGSIFRAVTFRNTTNNPTAVAATRTVTWRTNDGDALNNLSTAVTSTITVIETAASISSIAITSSAGGDSRYAIGETVEVSATFTEAVTVTGSPRMAVNGLSSRFFTYSAGSGTQTLVFSYTVVAGDSAASGIGVASNALALNGGAINDSVAAAATITHSAVALSSSHIVDGVLPTVTAFTSSTSNGSYMAGGTITISATTSETVQANSSIDVTLDTGAVVTLSNSSSGTTLTGTYTVGANQNSGDLTVSNYSITSVLDVAGNAMTSTTVPSGSSNIAGTKALIVDTTAPTISQMSVSADGSYKAGQSLTITAAGTTFTGTYTVTSGINSTDLTVTEFSIGTVLDTAGNSMTSTTLPTGSNAIGTGTAVVVDTTAPTVTSFTTTTANGSYKAGQTVNITATVSEPIRSNNSITVTLNSGATVTLSTNSVTSTLTGTYTIAAGQTAAMLNVNSFTIGTVADGAGNAMTSTSVPGGANIADSSSVVVDTTAPTITSFSSTTPNGAFKVGQTINITATASEAVRSGNTITATLNTNRTVLLTAPAAGTGFSGTYTVVATDTTSSLTVTSFSIGSVLDTA
ncbi:MAG: discoidin domain-containing protein, partial [Actinobacteria bacterium]|nr:discoidin domain-containing protein [Actinomycetota bacterium]